MTGQHAQARERAASAAQYFLLGGFAAVAAGISAQGLTGFARSNMALRGPWPDLLFLALDGAAGVCAVLLARRAARADGGLAPRLAVWGLVTASADFNFTHAPRRPAAPEAYALMPVIAAVLFEFCLREMRIRRTGRADRKLSGLRWLHPAERIRVQLHMAAHDQVSAGQATERVRAEQAARRLYQLRIALQARDRPGRPGALAAGRARRAQRRAQGALARVGFSDPDIAAEVLCQVQVLTMATTLARLDFTSGEAARAAIGNLITMPAAPEPEVIVLPVPPMTSERATAREAGAHDAAGQAAASPEDDPASTDGRDAQLVAAASRIVAGAAHDGTRLSQTTLADKLRGQGFTVSNDRLRWLAAVSGLESRPGRPPGTRASARARQQREEPVAVSVADRPADPRSPVTVHGTGHGETRRHDPGVDQQDGHPPGEW